MQGRLEAALAAVREDPANFAALTNLAYVLAREGKLDEAILLYHKAIGLNPSYAVAYSNLGLAYTEKGLFAQAREVYKTAITIAPDYAVAHLNLAQLYQLEGELNEAIEASWPSSRSNRATLRPSTISGLFSSRRICWTRQPHISGRLCVQIEITPGLASIWGPS